MTQASQTSGTGATSEQLDQRHIAAMTQAGRYRHLKPGDADFDRIASKYQPPCQSQEEPMTKEPIRSCACCGRDMPIKARRLCSGCYDLNRKANTLLQYPLGKIGRPPDGQRKRARLNPLDLETHFLSCMRCGRLMQVQILPGDTPDKHRICKACQQASCGDGPPESHSLHSVAVRMRQSEAYGAASKTTIYLPGDPGFDEIAKQCTPLNEIAVRHGMNKGYQP